MIKYDRDRLGELLCAYGNKFVCENGICEKKKTILWDEIDTIFLDGTKTTVNFIIPAGESINLRIFSTKGNKINLNIRAAFRMSGKDRDNFSDVYQFIISKIIDRQWTKLINDIKEGERVSFQSFDVTSSAIYRSKFFGGYETIELYRIAGCDISNGEFFIIFIDNKGRLKHKKTGDVRQIPNIHLVQTFLSTIGQNNLRALEEL